VKLELEFGTVPLTGSAVFTNGSSEVVGTGTVFLSEISRSGYVRPLSAADSDWAKTARIVSDTKILLDAPYGGATTAGDMVIQAEAVPQPIGATPGTLVLDGNGKLLAASGTKAGCGIGLWRQGDYGPMSLVGWLSLDARRANQKTWFGFRDDVAAPTIFVEFGFEGTDDTKVIFRTGFLGEVETTDVTLPLNSTTAQQLKYRITVTPEACEIQIADGPVVQHELHIPDPYAEMMISGGIVNTADEVESTLIVDCVLFQDFDRLAVKTY